MTVTGLRFVVFTELALALQREAAAARLELVPAFRSTWGARALRRRSQGTVVLVDPRQSVEGIAGDMIDGIVAANRLDGETAEAVRVRLWEAAQAVPVRDPAE